MDQRASHTGNSNGTYDIITDFSGVSGGSLDTINLSSYIPNGEIFVGATSFAANGINSIRYSESSGNTILEIDYNGDGVRDAGIQLNNFSGTTLQFEDFVLTAPTSGATVYTGTSGNDAPAAGAAGINIMYGLAGDDTLRGNTSTDYIYGGAGNDTLNGMRGADYIEGGTGNDTIIGGYGGDTIHGGAGNDIIYADNMTFSSSTVSGIAFWLDASNANGNGTSVAAGTALATWADLSGFSRNATRHSGGQEAIYTNNTLNGRSALNFNGSKQYNFGSSFNGNTSNLTLFSVTSGGTNPLGLFDSAPGQANPLRFFLNNTVEIWNANPAVSYTLNAGGSITATVASITSGRDLSVYQNGALSNSGTGTGTTPIAILSPVIGNINWTTTWGYNGYLQETILYNANVLASDRAIVDEYLSMKYGIALSGLSFGIDTLTGGSGADQFIWTNASHTGNSNGTYDIITDFSGVSGGSLDTINLSNYIPNGAIFVGATSFAANGINSIRYSESSGNTLLEIDYNGDGVVDAGIQLNNFSGITLQFEDFVLTAPTSGATVYTGTAGNNVQTGSAGMNVMYGLAGDDTLTGNTGRDFIYGGSDNDSLSGMRGADYIEGGTGNDTIIGGYGGDTIHGGAGNDIIYADNKTFAANSVADLKVWLDASNSVIARTGVNINSVSDLSGNGHHASLYAGTPTYLSASSYFGGHAAINFNGASTLRILNAAWLDSLDTSGLSVFTITSTTGQSNGGQSSVLFGIRDNGNAQTNMSSHYMPGSPMQQIATWNGSSANFYNYGDLTNKGLVNTQIWSTTTEYLLINETVVTNSARTIGSTDGLHIFLGSGPGTEYLFGNIPEILFYNRGLTTAEQFLIDEYLAMKYNIALANISFGIDTLTGGTGNDTFTWTNASHSGVGVGNRDIITDFKQSSGSWDSNELDTIDLTGLNLVYSGTDAFNGTANQMRWFTDTGNNRTVIQIDWSGDNNADMELQLAGEITLRYEDFTGLASNRLNNTLTGGVDNITGSSSDNEFTTTVANLSINDILNGSTGFDTLTISDNGLNLDLSTLTNLTNIERINITGSGANTLTVSVASVNSVTDANDDLYIAGNAGDTVNTGAGWTNMGAVNYYGVQYTQLNNGTTDLYIQTGVAII